MAAPSRGSTMTLKLGNMLPSSWRRYRILSSGATDPGKVRSNNEDAFVLFTSELSRKENGSSGQASIAVLADGVGGAIAGERASQLAVETIHTAFKAGAAGQDTGSVAAQLDNAIQAANQAIVTTAQADPELTGMASTIVIAIIEDSSLYIAHVGDSRSYLVRDGTAQQLTTDHSWIQSALDAGLLTLDEVENHPKRHVVTRSLGLQPIVEVDHTIRMPVQERGAQTDRGPATLVDRLLVHPGDIIVLCSDGLTDALSVEQIEQVVNATPFGETAQTLVNRANEAGGPDNVTVALMKVARNYWPAAIAGGGLISVLLLAGLMTTAALSSSALSSATLAAAPAPTITVASRATQTRSPAPSRALEQASPTLVPVVGTAAKTGAELPTSVSGTVVVHQTATSNFTGAAVPTPVAPQSASDKAVVPPPSSGNLETSRESLLSPVEGAELDGPVTFSWVVNADLQDPNRFYELVYWGAAESQNSARQLAPPIASSLSTTLSVQLGSISESLFPPGEYFWSVRVPSDTDGAPSTFLDAGRKFTYSLTAANSAVPAPTIYPGAVQTSSDPAR